MKWKSNREKWCHEAKLRQEEELLQECTFHNTHHRTVWNSVESNNNDQSSLSKSKEDAANHAFFEKNVRWAEIKNEKLMKERQWWDKMKLRDCTFQPNMTSSTLNFASNQSISDSFLHLSTPMLSIDASEVDTKDLVDTRTEND